MQVIINEIVTNANFFLFKYVILNEVINLMFEYVTDILYIKMLCGFGINFSNQNKHTKQLKKSIRVFNQK